MAKNDIDDFFNELENKNTKRTKGKSKRSNKKNKISDVKELIGSSNIKTKKNKKKKGWTRKRIVLTGLGGLVVVGIFLMLFIIITTPNINKDNIYERLSEATQILDDKGKVVDTVFQGDGERVNVKYADLNEYTVNAFISIEDKTFRKHHGFNFVRLLGAVKEAVTGNDLGGTSTITQQLARNIWLHETMSERSPLRKLREAYITIQLERKFSKDKIMEAYLNAIAFGNQSYGINLAAKNYFNKSVKKLTLEESALLAALPQAPSTYSYIASMPKTYTIKETKQYLVFAIPVEDGFVERKISKSALIKTTQNTYYYFNTAGISRAKTTLELMKENHYITAKQMNKAISIITDYKKCKKLFRVTFETRKNKNTYFTDYLIAQVIDDLMKYKGFSHEKAEALVYQGGLQIKSTLNSKMQQVAYEELENDSNYPSVVVSDKDSEGNILNKEGAIILYDMDNFFKSNGDLVLKKSDYTLRNDGTLLLKKNKRLKFYDVTYGNKKDINIEIPFMYEYIGNELYVVNGAVLNIPAKYKSWANNGDVLVDKKLFEDKIFKKTSDGITFSQASYIVREKVIQPQTAFVILDAHTGHVKAMKGGRKTSGQMMYNRAINPRQPGSSIKPLAVYAPAIEMGKNKIKISGGESNFGTYWTAASVINDKKITYAGGWSPKNYGGSFKGYMTLKDAIRNSINTVAVQIQMNIGNDRSVESLKKFGITTIETENKSVNDLNAAALALGGLTHGIKPIESAAAYSAFVNGGVRSMPVAYTSILDQSGKNVLLDGKIDEVRAISEETAYIMNQLLQSVVSGGTATGASGLGFPVGGKTGTTTDNYDAWFVGFTPKYTAALWIGNDVGIKLSESSAVSVRVWAKIMRRALAGGINGNFLPMPNNVVSAFGGFYFVKGTVPGKIVFPDDKPTKPAVTNPNPKPTPKPDPKPSDSGIDPPDTTDSGIDE